eukprot:m51a1_g7324 hypothetical protein (367) ;mRNA; f:153412-154512
MARPRWVLAAAVCGVFALNALLCVPRTASSTSPRAVVVAATPAPAAPTAPQEPRAPGGSPAVAHRARARRWSEVGAWEDPVGGVRRGTAERLRAALRAVNRSEEDADCGGAKAGQPAVNVAMAQAGREGQLEETLPWVYRHLRGQAMRLTVVSDTGGAGMAEFNRGALLNVGFLAGEGESVWTMLHDVDRRPPRDVCYVAPRPHETVEYATVGENEWPTFLGAVAAVRNEDFAAADGFSNRFRGWGKEDELLSNRMHAFEGHPATRWSLAPQSRVGRWEHDKHERRWGASVAGLLAVAKSSGGHRRFFAGDGLSRLRRGPGSPWLAAQQVELWDGVFLVGVDLSRFDPCCNGESGYDLRPCNCSAP